MFRRVEIITVDFDYIPIKIYKKAVQKLLYTV